ncbi:polyketide cyclase/dehydrase/lipid transport protein [Yoonia maritima]|uniref:Polyketide cyclase/dehydrase/lipid transport protein n=1 Tax=Yoonia maritima TaxID=1435347 RepID=A0A2T0W017_9RHOB|nr:SRPBCC family protein [Yoonia maritima]PRY78114.1 polyketide cyclase/dehydrase/lipid transport protein [Yoonia maritima]
MKFSTREDIEAPADYVFAHVTDFAGFERRALRYGAQVSRVGQDQGAPTAGTEWEIAFKFRGRNRTLDAKLTEFSAPVGYQVTGVTDGMHIVTDIELVSLSPTRTRLLVGVDLRSKSFTARLVIQSMKLAKAKLNKRFRARVLEFSEDIEEGYRKGQ